MDKCVERMRHVLTRERARLNKAHVLCLGEGSPSVGADLAQVAEVNLIADKHCDDVLGEVLVDFLRENILVIALVTSTQRCNWLKLCSSVTSYTSSAPRAPL